MTLFNKRVQMPDEARNPHSFVGSWFERLLARIFPSRRGRKNSLTTMMFELSEISELHSDALIPSSTPIYQQDGYPLRMFDAPSALSTMTASEAPAPSRSLSIQGAHVTDALVSEPLAASGLTERSEVMQMPTRYQLPDGAAEFIVTPALFQHLIGLFIQACEIQQPSHRLQITDGSRPVIFGLTRGFTAIHMFVSFTYNPGSVLSLTNVMIGNAHVVAHGNTFVLPSTRLHITWPVLPSVRATSSITEQIRGLATRFSTHRHISVAPQKVAVARLAVTNAAQTAQGARLVTEQAQAARIATEQAHTSIIAAEQAQSVRIAAEQTEAAGSAAEQAAKDATAKKTDESFSVRDILIFVALLLAITFAVLYMTIPAFAAGVTMALASAQAAFFAAATAAVGALKIVGAFTLGLFNVSALSAGATAAIGGAVIFSGLAIAALLIGAVVAAGMKIADSIAQSKAENAAAVKIQSVFRGYSDRKLVQELRATPARSEHAPFMSAGQEDAIVERLTAEGEAQIIAEAAHRQATVTVLRQLQRRVKGTGEFSPQAQQTRADRQARDAARARTAPEADELTFDIFADAPRPN